MAASSSTAASISSSTAAHSNNNQCCDVFINHRGPDTKETLARPLYHSLREKRLRVFLDDQELLPGYNFPSQIKNAIATASVHVAIFSPRYAESDWCLEELQLMVESKAPIIPVFYDVTPAEVRWTPEGKSYDRDLKKRAEKRTKEGKLRYDSKTIQNWRDALSKVADNMGDTFNSAESELELLLNKVVKSVLKMVKKPDLYVADHPTGLDHKLTDFEQTVLLQLQQSGKPLILGITGFGGIGKTTLAKEFFNRRKSNYFKSCFLSEVKEKAAKGSLISLQIELLKSLNVLDEQVNSVDEGKGMLIKPLKSLNALVVLDDVDDVDQVTALLPVQPHQLCSGSLILITSRDKRVLTSSRVENSAIYKLAKLNREHSQELFCLHAFRQTYPSQGYEDVVDKFLVSCNGLPLSLKVLGAHLYGRQICEWEVELGRLPRKVKKQLKISYDALDDEDQQMFLDIACLFPELQRDTAISMWDGSGWTGRRGVQNLEDKCLIEVDNWNMIHMHEHLRNLGQDIAQKSLPFRLWRWTKNVVDHLSQQSTVIPVRGIKVYRSEYNDRDMERVLRGIDTRSLQILEAEGVVVERILRRAELSDMELPNMFWLSWIECPYVSLPSWIQVKNLRHLQVSGSELITLWETESESQLPALLHNLLAIDCVKLKTINGLAHCTKLRLLYVNGCSELEELPSMETLISLEDFQSSKCVKLKRIQGLAHCTKLRVLYVDGCSELEALPSMETLISLEDFRSSECVKLKRIQGLAHCTKLRFLTVSGCSELKELPSMETFVSLERLTARRCVKLKRIQGLAHCTKLRVLYVDGCSELEELPSMETLISLEDFRGLSGT